jgi:hypothetical protein
VGEVDPKMRREVERAEERVEGEAKPPPREISDKPVEMKWVRVRRVWAKKDGRWILILQHLSQPEDEKEPERKEK